MRSPTYSMRRSPVAMSRSAKAPRPEMAERRILNARVSEAGREAMKLPGVGVNLKASGLACPHEALWLKACVGWLGEARVPERVDSFAEHGVPDSVDHLDSSASGLQLGPRTPGADCILCFSSESLNKVQAKLRGGSFLQALQSVETEVRARRVIHRLVAGKKGVEQDSCGR